MNIHTNPSVHMDTRIFYFAKYRYEYPYQEIFESSRLLWFICYTMINYFYKRK